MRLTPIVILALLVALVPVALANENPEVQSKSATFAIEALDLSAEAPFKVKQTRTKKGVQLEFTTSTDGSTSMKAAGQSRAEMAQIRDFGSIRIEPAKRMGKSKDELSVLSVHKNLKTRTRELGKKGWELLYEHGSKSTVFYSFITVRRVNKRWFRCSANTYSAAARPVALAVCQSLASTRSTNKFAIAFLALAEECAECPSGTTSSCYRSLTRTENSLKRKLNKKYKKPKTLPADVLTAYQRYQSCKRGKRSD